MENENWYSIKMKSAADLFRLQELIEELVRKHGKENVQADIEHILSQIK